MAAPTKVGYYQLPVGNGETAGYAAGGDGPQAATYKLTYSTNATTSANLPTGAGGMGAVSNNHV